MICQFGNVSGLFKEFKKSLKKQQTDSKMFHELLTITRRIREACKAMQETLRHPDFVDLPKFKNV